MTNQLSESIKIKQPHFYELFTRVFSREQFAHAYLIESSSEQEGIAFSQWLAEHLFCNEKKEGNPCGTCVNCERIARNDFPDMLIVAPDGQSIKVDQIREIKKVFTQKGFESNKNLVIIQQSEKMTNQAANALLKFIEEPDGETYILFLTNNSNQIISTIQSRCQLVTLRKESKESIKKTLLQHTTNEQVVYLISELMSTSEEAVELLENEWFNGSRETVKKWVDLILKKHPMSFIYVQQHIIKLSKDKKEQLFILDMVLCLLKYEMLKDALDRPIHLTVAHLELVLDAKVKLGTHVSFQNVCEQLVWRLIR